MGDVKIGITGDNSGLIAALTEAKGTVADSAEQMKASIEGISAAFEKVQQVMLAVTSVLAGGKAFSEAIQTSVQAAVGAQQLGRALGITATQASVLKVAMDENFVSTEAVTGASNKIATTLKKNESAFTQLGVATRDSNGNFRNSFDIMTDVNAKLGEFKEGTDRNVEGMKIYGRSWQEIAPTIRLTATAMEDAKEKAVSLGLVVGVEGIAQVQAYRTAMAGVHTVIDALGKVVGDALMPVLTSLGQWFVSVGPQAVAAMRAAIYGVYAAFSYLKEGVTIATDYIAGQIDVLGAEMSRFANTAARVLHFDFSGATAAWAAGTKDIENKSKFMSDAIAQDMAAATAAREKFFESQDAQQTATSEGTGAASSGGDEQMKSQMAAFEAALAQRKAAWQSEQAAEGSYREFGKQAEVEYWQNILATTKVSANDRNAILKQIATDEIAIQKQAFEGDLAQLKTQEAAHKNNMTARLAIEQEYAAKVKAAYGEDSKEYADAQKAIVETKRSAVEQQRQLDDLRQTSARTAALNEIQVEEDAAKLKYDNGRLSLDQYVALEKSFEDRKLAIRREALQQELAIAAQDPDSSPVKVAQINAQIEALETQHQAAIFKIQQQEIAQSTAIYKSFTDKLGQSFSTAFQGIINGTQTMGQAFRSVFTSMLSAVVTFIAQWAAKMLVQHLIAMAQNKQEAASNAAVAATGGAKSAAAIPYVGWALAIGAAASIFAAASRYSAQDGFDVPSGLNPMTQLHSREMVLPQQQADVIRNMAQGGDGEGEGGAGGGDIHVHLPGTRQGNMFMMHNDDLVAAIKHAHRAGKLSKS